MEAVLKDQLRGLLLRIDKASTGCRVQHLLYGAMPHGLSLMGDCIGDEFHEAWNSVKRTIKASDRMLSVICMLVFYNLMYGPWLSAAFQGSRRELLLEFCLVHPAVTFLWRSRLGGNSADLPTTLEDVEESIASRIRDNSALVDKGPYVRLMCWFSLFSAIDFHDHTIEDSREV